MYDSILVRKRIKLVPARSPAKVPVSISAIAVLLHISSFTLFTPKLPPLGVVGHEIYNFLSPYPTDATYQIWLRLAQ